jgi:hypothetical protein
MVYKIGFVLALIFVLIITVAYADPNMKEGLWEITTQMEVSGMTMQMPPHTHIQCLTKKDMVPQKHQKGEDECKITKQKIKEDTVSWIAECNTSEGTMYFSGKITYAGNTFSGVMKMKDTGSKMSGMEMTQRISGRWIKECEE